MSSIREFLRQRGSRDGRQAGAVSTEPMSEERRAQANLFLDRLGRGVRVGVAAPRKDTQKEGDAPPPPSAPQATPSQDEHGAEGVPGSAEDKLADEHDAPEDVESADAEPLVDGIEKEGSIPPDVRDFEPFEKSASAASMYQSRRPHPLELFGQLGKDFRRMAWASWTPEQTWLEIREKTGANPSPVVRNMIGALRGLVESEAFWNEHHAFMWTAQALNGEIPDFSVLPELTPEQIAFAVHVAGKIRDGDPVRLPDKSEIPGVTYDDQVLAAIAAICHMHGLLVVPSPVPAGGMEQIRRLQDADAKAMSREVEAAWGKLEKMLASGNRPSASQFDPMEPLDIQLARLVAIWEYVNNPHAE